MLAWRQPLPTAWSQARPLWWLPQASGGNVSVTCHKDMEVNTLFSHQKTHMGLASGSSVSVTCQKDTEVTTESLLDISLATV